MTQPFLMRSGSLMGFEQAVNELGGDVVDLLAQVNLTLPDIRNGDSMIPVKSMVLLLEYGAQQLACSDFGLRVSQFQDWSSLGHLGLLLKHCDSLESITQSIARYFPLHTYAEDWSFREEGDYTYITRSEKYHGISHACQHRELSFGVCLRLIQDFVGNSVTAARLEFSHKPQSDLNVYKQYFPMDIRFNQESDRLIIQNHQLPIRSDEQSRQFRRQAESNLSKLILDHEFDIEQQVRTIILQTLGDQQHSIDNVARLLNLNRRTLQRKLKARDLDYKMLLNDIRMKSACWYLQSSDVEITLLSEILGYSDVSAFSHAFKNNMQCSARQWRDQQKLSSE